MINPTFNYHLRIVGMKDQERTSCKYREDICDGNDEALHYLAMFRINPQTSRNEGTLATCSHLLPFRFSRV
jgi:hypothetical protein